MPANSIIQLRTGTAAQWSSANPILAMGEEGYESDTGKMKIGNGSSAWSSLSYGGPIGPAQIQVLEGMGDGSDGNFTQSSGVYTLTRDQFWLNLTVNGTGQINTAGYRIFVAGILDITAAGAGAIFNNGGNGGNSTTQTGGTAGTAGAGVTVGAGNAGTNGATGVVGAGVEAAAPTAGNNGGPTNTAGASGAGGPNGGPTSGATGRPGATPVNVLPIRRYEQDLFRGAALLTAGSGGPGGSAGSGDGTTVGNSCGGGAGGGGAGIVGIWANYINRSSSTADSAIQALGGNGGNGRNAMGTYTFTISAGSTASIGATYTNNSQTFIITTTVTNVSTTVVAEIVTSGTPTNTGTLTLASGTGSSTITYTAVTTASDSTNATAGVGGGGGGSGGGGGWLFLQYNNLANTFTFTISSSTVSQNAIYSNNSQTFMVATGITSSTTLTTAGTGLPSASGTLTLVSGTGPSTISFSAYTGTVQTATNALNVSGGNGGVGGNGTNNYTFTITAGQTASIGATLTNNSQTFYVTTTLTGAQTTLVCVGTGSPTASGNLTFSNGTHSAGPVVYSAFTAGTTAAGANGGSGGNGGRITLLQIPTSVGSESFTGTGTTGSAASGIFGGNLGAGATNKVSL